MRLKQASDRKFSLPGWSDFDFDFYASPGRTYGLLPSRLLKMWSDMVGMMDANDGTSLGGQLWPVDAKLLPQAVQEHEQNPNVFELFRRYNHQDQSVGGSVPLGDCSSIYWRREIQESNVPMLVFASWLDAGTTMGSIPSVSQRLATPLVDISPCCSELFPPKPPINGSCEA